MDDKIRALLDDKSIKGKDIAKGSGVAESVISRLRTGKRKIDKLNVATAKKLEKYYDSLEKEK